MKEQTIFKKLREMDVPVDLAHRMAEQYADRTTDLSAIEIAQKAIERDARKKAVELERRKFRTWCRGNGLPNPVHEFEFHPERKWRADWAWPDPDGGGVLLEIDGGGHRHGRHHRPKGFAEDQVKRNEAIRLGFHPLHCTPQTLYAESTLSTLKALLGAALPQARSA